MRMRLHKGLQSASPRVRESTYMENQMNLIPLTQAEILEMHAQPAWCKETQCYGIICVEDGGQWKDIPFFFYIDPGHLGHRTHCQFSLNVNNHGLTLYRCVSKSFAPIPYGEATKE